MIDGAFVLPLVTLGMTLASATRRFGTALTPTRPPAAVTVICDIGESALAPCQWRSPALMCTTSPTVISRSSVSLATIPLPAVTTSI